MVTNIEDLIRRLLEFSAGLANDEEELIIEAANELQRLKNQSNE